MSSQPPPETLAVFGATGQTGRHVVRIALEELGWTVRAMARTPSKLPVQGHANLTVIEGDFADGDAVRETVRGCTRVVCCGGGPHSNSKYPKFFMRDFVRDALWPALREEAPASLLFQAGALSKTHRFPTFAQVVVAPMMGLWPMARDNDAVLRFVRDHPLDGTGVVCTRPGALREGKGGSRLKVSRFPNQTPLAFADLARFNLEAVLDEGLFGKMPYVR